MKPDRICHIHAGTHKTASTYIQSRLERNRQLLAGQNLLYEFPGRSRIRHKPLAVAANKSHWRRWNRYLAHYQGKNANLLWSAEQFTLPLCNPRLLSRICKILQRHGFTLNVVIFVRPQLEYMNSRYVYNLRRLYRVPSFEDYVLSCLASGDRDIYNYNQLYAPLLDSGVRCTFLPFHRMYGDPFLRLLRAVGLDPQRNYSRAQSGHENIQSGTRGVWLSRLIVDRLVNLGYTGRDLKATSKLVRQVAESRGWHKERFFGFSSELMKRTLDHYAEGNDIFSQRVWGRSWNEVFPPQVVPRSVYVPRTPAESLQMEKLADQLVARLASRNPHLATALRGTG